MSLLADLHCHTCFSDGALSPAQVIETARLRELSEFALTDHDTDAAYEKLRDTGAAQGLHLVAGAEFSTRWRHYDVHVVALNFNRDDRGIRRLFERQAAARCERNRQIAAQLARFGVDNAIQRITASSQTAQLGRVHFAELLVADGHAKNRKQAFKRYLGHSGRAYVKTAWASLEEICAVVDAAGGSTVLAHPMKYPMTFAKLGECVAEFAALGGTGIEVVSGRQSPGVGSQLARLAARFDLLASIGSDFHRPGEPWAEIGRCGMLPTACRPIWEAWR